jgi:hypothetical protein
VRVKWLIAGTIVYLLAGSAFAQNVGSIDLSRPVAAPKHTDAGKLPAGCKKLSPGMIADGLPDGQNNTPHKIVVEVIGIRNRAPAIASEVVAEVRVRNSDSRPITIPWSTDFSRIRKGQPADAVQWDQATFDFTLRDQQGNHVALKSATGFLVGSESVAGSELTLQPGDSITAAVRFAVEEEFPIPPLSLKPGEWRLSATWHQTGRSWGVRNCQVSNLYVHYEQFYEQQNPSVAIQILAKP